MLYETGDHHLTPPPCHDATVGKCWVIMQVQVRGDGEYRQHAGATFS